MQLRLQLSNFIYSDDPVAREDIDLQLAPGFANRRGAILTSKRTAWPIAHAI
jgi:hypothetical protein